MASRWRIRHKLLLGVCLVCAVMALLLGGTLHGLWSYYVTMNSIRSKKAEQQVAKELENEIHDLKSFEKLPGEAVFVAFTDLPRKSQKAREQLRAYEEQLQETLNQGRDPSNGAHQLATVKALKDDFEALDKAAKASPPARMDNGGDGQVKEDLWDQVQPQIKTLIVDSGDLSKNIDDDINERIDESRAHYQVTLWIVVPSSAAGLLIMIGLMRSFYAWVFNPIRDLERGVVRVARGDFSHRIEVHSGDEMEDLGAAFNDMMERLRGLYDNLAQQVNDRSRQLVRSEKLASVGFLAAGVAHEINNPLASIAFCSEALESRLGGLVQQLQKVGSVGDDAEVFTRYLRMIQDEAFRCKNITERLLAFSRTGERRREPTDLSKVVQSVLEVTQHLQSAKGKTIALEAPAGNAKIIAAVNAEEIKSVVLNLVVNALDSMEEGGKLTIRLVQRVGTAELYFTDTGCGMTREVLDNIFEPFFTHSRTGKGTGLGLTISHSIVSQHGGEIEASSPGPKQGSTFVVRLPLQAAEETEAAPALAA